MKILIIMGGFFPGKKFGGPPVSVSNFCKLLNDNDCYIYTYNHELGSKEPYPDIPVDTWLDKGCYRIKYVNGSDYCKNGFERVIQELDPDIIYLQGLFQSCILPCLELAKRYDTKVLLAPRGELCSGAFKKKYKKIPYILYLKFNGLLRNVYYQSTSDEETEAIQRILGSERNRIFFLTNIPSIPSRDYERKPKESGYAKFVFLARIHPKKNLLGAITYFASIKGNVTFDIYGPVEDEEYWGRCQKEIAKLSNNIKVSYCGLLSHEEVHETFSKYDAFLFPTLSENYGHVIAESLFVGTPVIISDQTPWTDVNDYNAGFAVNLSDKAGFIAAIQKIIDSTNGEMKNIVADSISYVKNKTDIEHIRKKYIEAFESVKKN